MKSRKIGYTINKSKKISKVYLKNNKKIYGNGKKIKKSQKIYKQKSKIPKKKSIKIRKTTKKCAKQWCHGYYTKKECEDKHHKFITKSKKIGKCKWKNKKCGVSMKFKMGKDSRRRRSTMSMKRSEPPNVEMSIVDNQVVKLGPRKFVKISFNFTNGPKGCQTFYLSTGVNSKIKGLWFPINGVSTMIDGKIKKEKFSDPLWKPKIAKVPWVDEDKAQDELKKIKKTITLDNLLYRTDNNKYMAIISCILSTTFETFDCSMILNINELNINELNVNFNIDIENIRNTEIEIEDYRDLANWIGICNSFNWNPLHDVGRNITSAVKYDGDEYLSLWQVKQDKQDGDVYIPPAKPNVNNIKEYIEILERIKNNSYNEIDNIVARQRQKQKDKQQLRIFFNNIKSMHTYGTGK